MITAYKQASPASIDDLTGTLISFRLQLQAIFRWCVWCFNISGQSPAAGCDQKEIMSSCGPLVPAAGQESYGTWSCMYDVSTMKVKSCKSYIMERVEVRGCFCNSSNCHGARCAAAAAWVSESCRSTWGSIEISADEFLWTTAGAKSVIPSAAAAAGAWLDQFWVFLGPTWSVAYSAAAETQKLLRCTWTWHSWANKYFLDPVFLAFVAWHMLTFTMRSVVC